MYDTDERGFGANADDSDEDDDDETVEEKRDL